MFKLIVLLLLSWRVQGGAEVDADTRIVGGKEAPDGIAPYQVSLRASDRGGEYHFCGGSILNKNWIVTAAHCTIDSTANEITIVAGTNSLTSGGDRYKVSKIINHEGYSVRMHRNDVSVVKIDGDFTFGDKVNTIELASSDIEAKTECLLTGWGYTDNSQTVPDKLQMLTVKTISLKECNSRMSRFKSSLPINGSEICTFVKDGQGVCQGDSGGPLVYNKELVGVVSWGVPCAVGYPDIFMNAYAYKDWINDKISQ